MQAASPSLTRALFVAPWFVVLILMVPVCAAQSGEHTQLAAAFELPKVPALPSLTGPSADWRQFDSFFTFVVKRFADDVPASLRDSLGDAFLDSRYELSSAVAPGKGGNPVPELFTNGWKRLSPIMNKSLPAMPKQAASLYSGFMSAADRLSLTGGSGLNLTPDALRGMARVLAPSGAGDPLAFNTTVDSSLRNLLGFGAPLAVPGRRSRLDRRFFPRDEEKASLFPFSWVGSANAAEPVGKNLNQLLPDLKDLQTYLTEIRALLVNLSDKITTKFKLAEEHKILYRQIVFAAAWQESCWRQFVKKGTPVTSASGDLGLMQVNRHTWRGVYDLKHLGGDIEYNGNAGGEILLNYLTRTAIRKGEDKQPGGHLARATYSAYNGGPSAVGRYRGVRQTAEWRKVDEAFWQKFEQVSAGREMDVRQCYQK